jgi:alpha-L-rhamnosidase
VQYGFRYMLLNYSGSVAWAPTNATLTMLFTNTAAPRIAEISFSDPLLAAIQAATVTSAASNWMSIPTDCPQRAERLGWMGDAYTSGETQLHNFDLAGAYESFLAQIEDNQPGTAVGAQPGVAGGVPDCVPFYGGHCHLPSSPSWGSAFPSLANWVYEYYDDAALVRKHYLPVRAYVDSLTARAIENDKVNHTLLDTGGWGKPPPPPPPLPHYLPPR